MTKTPDYHHAGRVSTHGSKTQSKTAAERLEADKLKYVKSSTARQRRFTLELHTSASPHNDSTGTHSISTASTGSPVNVDDDDVSEHGRYDPMGDINHDNIQRCHSSGPFHVGVQHPRRGVVRSSTDTEINKKFRTPPFQRSKVCSEHAAETFSPIIEKPDILFTATESKATAVNTTTVTEAATSQLTTHLLKDSRGNKTFSSYLSKAREGIKAVTSTLAGGNESVDDRSTPKARQARSPIVSKSSKFRSASAGANVPRNRESLQKNNVKSSVDNSAHDSRVLSPRTQLKQARQNLKKVGNNLKCGNRKIDGALANRTNDSSYISPASKLTGTTFTIQPRQLGSENVVARSIGNNVVDKVSKPSDKATIATKSGYLRSRPLSVIENGDTRNFFKSGCSREDDKKALVQGNGVVLRRPSTTKEPGEDADVNRSESKNGNSGPGEGGVRRVPSQRLNRRSWDLARTMDSSLHLAVEKPVLRSSSPTADRDTLLAAPIDSAPRQRKSWSKLPAPSETQGLYKRNLTSRTSYPEDLAFNRPGGRKSITEALEEIFNPLEQDYVTSDDTTASPDANAEARTIVGQSLISASTLTENQMDNFFDNSTADRLRNDEDTVDRLSRSKSPESSRSKTPTGNPDCFGANDVDIGACETVAYPLLRSKSKNSCASSPESVGRHHNVCRTTSYPDSDERITEQQRLWTNYQDTPVSQPLSRIDLAPVSDRQALSGIPSSPMLAPRSRREVAPDCNIRSNTNSLNTNGVKDESLNTIRSQTTSSSASVDVNKPFTALTASDLKPRKTKRNINPSEPLKPTYPYMMPQGANARSNAKRHTNAPVSPTISPHKQPARMTPPHGSRSTSSTPYSSLKRTPTSSRSSSLKRNRQRSKSDVSIFQNELDRFFSTMGMDEAVVSPLPVPSDTLFTTAQFSSESDFSFAGASAYVRDGPDETSPMDLDPMTASLAQVPSVSIIEKNARIMRWLAACNKSYAPSAQPFSGATPRSPLMPVSVPYRESNQTAKPVSPRSHPRQGHRSYGSPMKVNSHVAHVPSQVYTVRHPQPYVSTPPPIPPRIGIPKESDV